jgi:polypeptide N-acetylgalactosaminyltransferase
MQILHLLSGWLEPLLDRIAKNSTTVVCPIIDTINDTTLAYHISQLKDLQIGGFEWNLEVASRLNK